MYVNNCVVDYYSSYSNNCPVVIMRYFVWLNLSNDKIMLRKDL